MDEELKKRFVQQKLKELLEDSTQPFPTYIFEMERPEVNELVRKFCLLSPKMIPFKVKFNLSYVSEGLERKKEVKDYGDLYVLVNVN
ncbi:MAG: hypothetical protein WCK92_07955 [Bacteroidota bacterium]